MHTTNPPTVIDPESPALSQNSPSTPIPARVVMLVDAVCLVKDQTSLHGRKST